MTNKLFENPCGGCGEKYSNKRCLGCMHEMPTQVRPMTSDRVSNEDWTRDDLAEALASVMNVPTEQVHFDMADDLLSHLSLCVSTSPVTVSDEIVQRALKEFKDKRHDYDDVAMRDALTVALAPAEQEGEDDHVTDWQGLGLDVIEYRHKKKPAASTHPGADRREIVERLREYAKDWRTRAASADVVDEAADIIEAVERELSDWQNGHANSVRAHAAAITRAETAEASLAAAREALEAAWSFICQHYSPHIDSELKLAEEVKNTLRRLSPRAALAGSNGK